MAPLWPTSRERPQQPSWTDLTETESKKSPLPTINGSVAGSIIGSEYHPSYNPTAKEYAAPERICFKKRFRLLLGSPISCCSVAKIPLYYFIIGAVLAMIFAAALIGFVLGIRQPHGRIHYRNLTVDLEYSRYVGIQANDGVDKWLGIRYAAPPVGDLRFRAPVDPMSDSKTYIADKHAPLCYPTFTDSINSTSSEDCLFLDVYAPSSRSKLHPVFVFIQGGGFNVLSNPNLDGQKLIKAGNHDIVVVTFNYRVGPWGFLASEEVKANGDINVGLLDQRKVLEWVQKHIKQFGGDPDHVTLGGSSAGAGSVALHLTAYGGRDDNLFHAVAAGSPSFGAKLTVEGSQYQYDALVERVNCSDTADTLQCLRDLDIKTLAENNPNTRTPGGGGGYPLFPYSNVIDGNFTPENLYSLFSKGQFVRVPVIFGDDTNEGTIFTPSSINNVTDMNNFLKDNIPNLNAEQLDQIDDFYPRAEQFPNKGEYWRSAANAYGEIRYICPGIHINTQFPIHDLPQSWNFRWDVLERKNAESGLGVTHTSDLSSIWGTSDMPENELTPTIQGYWTSFIRSYNPNTHKLDDSPSWEPFSLNHMQRLHLAGLQDVSMEDIEDEQKKRCDYFSAQSRSLSM